MTRCEQGNQKQFKSNGTFLKSTYFNYKTTDLNNNPKDGRVITGIPSVSIIQVILELNSWNIKYSILFRIRNILF